MTAKDPRRADRIVEFVRAFRMTHDYGPTVSEVRSAVGLAYPSAALWVLRNLRRDGRIEWDETEDGRMVSGSIRLTDGVVCALCGRQR